MDENLIEVGKLNDWYLRCARALPWRKTRDPYSIWVSEVMLQQTQVATVLPYYEKFLKKFPTVQSLARARTPSVLKEWSGLGYYSRARNLHRGAKYITKDLSGRFPNERLLLLSIPGIGPYTAGAIASIAYDRPEPIVDGNVKRVFSRFYGLKNADTSRAMTFFWKKAAEWVQKADSPCVLNQALMELGATICTKSIPKCDLCPIQKNCFAFKNEMQSELPSKKVRRRPIDLWWAPLIFEKNGKIFLQKNPAGTWWQGMWDFPRLVSPVPMNEINQSAIPLAKQRHSVTHHRITVTPFLIRANTRRKGIWVPIKRARLLETSSLVKKILRDL